MACTNQERNTSPGPRRGTSSARSPGVLSAIGETPLVRLDRLFPGAGFQLHAKLEALNPGGSSKDRPAVAIIDAGLRSGAIGPETVIVESSSGNMGIGLAQACRYHGLRFICVVDPKASALNRKIIAAYGAEIDLVTEPDPATGEWLQARLNRVQQLLGVLDHSFWPNQYANPENPTAHYRTTIAEVARALDDRIDFLFVATSTCGTLRGCGEYVRDRRLPTRVVAVDAVGSLIFGDAPLPRLIPGLGASMRPPLCDPALVEQVVHVSDRECVAGCRRLVDREAILAGGSSGGVIAAVDRIRDSIPGGSTCVAILPDRGERYLDTIYDDDWVTANLGPPERLVVAPREPGALAAACR
jgi:N-(2-amino-2-carboxyethyl)-L-glutamate synthase